METIKTQMKSKFLQVCIGISIVLMSAGFFMHSISSATATPLPAQLTAGLKSTLPTAGDGSIMMNWNVNKDGAVNSIAVWNTQTGKYAYYKADNGKFTKFTFETIGVPSPLVP